MQNANAQNTRALESARAAKVQSILGNGYELDYDACESCMTYCYYRGTLYKVVPNSAFSGSVNVYDFAAPTHIKALA